MSGFSDVRRITRRVVSILATVGLLSGMLAVTSGPASAAGPRTCSVENTTLPASYTGVTGSVLQTAIHAARSGDTLAVRGTCVGNFTIVAKTLTLMGKPTHGHPVTTLDGNGSGSVLNIGSGAVVTLTDLLITGGSGSFHGIYGPYGGGIHNNGTLTLDGSAAVSTNTAETGGGIANFGTLTLNDSARVNGNTASFSSGGIYIFLGTLTLNDSAQVDGNVAQYGGAIQSASGTVTLNGSARLSGNTAEQEGGGISTGDGTLTLNDSARINDNTAAQGGGIIIGEGSTVTLNDFAQVNRNTANADQSEPNAGFGGGINQISGSLTLNDSAQVRGNRASADGGGIYHGGGIMNGAIAGGNVYKNKPNDIAP